ncbi:uncharacterized protein [Pyrus communis]|uniref:uncharacterized protein n=1 Tax=Pyrus communis TaxID=23211 RepID=UPI0035BEEFB6
MPMIEHTTQEQRQAAVSSTMERLLAHWYAITKQPHSGINLVEFLAEADDGPVLTFDKVQAAPAELEDHRPQVKDPLEEVNVGTADDPRTLFISALLPPAMKVELRELLHEFKDCFAWSYHEMPGLDRNLVEHELRIKEGCKPFRQPHRRFSNEVQLGIKEELVRLLKVGFIRTARYVEWLANIVLVLKKNANHELLSFMDGHAGYNQIFIADADVHKTAFHCPGALGTYEWVVMPFGLKNAGATYQRAMNMIFHDLIGTIVEVYIDDVVVKSKRRQTHLDDLRQAFLRMRKNNLKMNPAKCAFGVSAGRIGKWTLALSEFSLQYVPQKAVKGQALADFLAQHPSPYGFEGGDVDIGFVTTRDNHWTMHFDGSSTSTSAGVGIAIQSPDHCRWYFSLKLDFSCTNNQAEYEALIIGLHVLHDLRASRVLVLGDSELVINQLNGIFRCMSCTLAPYHMVATYLAESFERITFEHISRTHNTDADELAQIASGAQLMGGKLGRIAATGLQSYPALIDRQNFQRTHVIRTRVMSLPSLLERGDPVEVCAVEVEPDDWRKIMLRYLDNPNGKHDRRTKVLATNYVSYQNELYRKGEDGLLLLCLSPHEADQAMAERAPAELLHSVTKPWPFRGWAMDVIGKITPSSGAARHAWIMVATDYFTKWVEARSYAELTAKEVCDFVEENIVTRFGVPETIITDNGTIFTADRFREYAASLNIRLEQSTPYYLQANCVAYRD